MACPVIVLKELAGMQMISFSLVVTDLLLPFNALANKDCVPGTR